jgi:hypothetical protein
VKIRDKHVIKHSGVEKVYCQKIEEWTLLVTCAQCLNCKGYDKQKEVIKCKDIEYK